MQILLQDLRYALRVLAKSRGFTVVAILTLAVGIGANTAVFSLLDAVLLKSVPVKNPSELVLLQWHGHKGPRYKELSSFGDCDDGKTKDYRWGCSFSSPTFDAFVAETKSFDGATGFAGPEEVQLAGLGPARVADAEIVTGNYFHTLGVAAALGRTIEPTDDTPSAPPVAVLSYGYWQRAFGADPAVVGKTVRLNNISATIVGVAASSFTHLSPGRSQHLWITRWSFSQIGYNEHWSRAADPRNAWLAVVARLRPGVSRAQAQEETSLLFRNEMLHGSHPLMDPGAEPGITLIPADQGLTGQRASVAPQLSVLMLMVGILLLIACANVAALLRARSVARRREIAMRLTLGAPKSRIVRQLLTESVLLSGCGGILGTIFAYWGVRVFAQLVTRSGASFPFPVTPDFRILAFTAAVSIFTGVLFGIFPAWQSTRADLAPTLTGAPSGSGVSPGATNRWFAPGNVLVIAQVGLAVIVLTGAGLLVRTLQNLDSIDTGFDARNLLLFTVDPVVSGYKIEQIQTLYRDLQNDFSGLPGVSAVAYSQYALLNNSSSSHNISVEGRSDDVTVNILPIGPAFFDAMRIPLLQGRGLRPQDFETASVGESASVSAAQQAPEHPQPLMPVIVNEAFVRAYCGARNALGMKLNQGAGSTSAAGVSDGKIWSRQWEIVGVVGNTKYAKLREDNPPILYLPLDGGGARFEVRTALAPESLMPAVREIVARHDSELPVFNVMTEEKSIEQQTSEERLLARLSSFFGGLELLLACIGLYGLLSYHVTTRTQEIGIRMALGAEPTSLLRLILGKGMVLAVLGSAVGITASVWATRLIKSWLFGVKATDAITLAAVSVLLVLVALAASYIPARRAMRVDPMVALRHQ